MAKISEKVFRSTLVTKLWPEERSATTYTAPFAMELPEMEIA